MILQAQRRLFVRFLTGYPGVVVLMFIGLVYSGLSSRSEVLNKIEISINFKTLRKLEYQVWISKDFPEDYADLDQLTANIKKHSGPVGILIKALPYTYSSADGRNLSYQIESDDGSLHGFLIAESEKAQKIFQAQQGLWKKLSLNGKDLGSYLYVENNPELNELNE